jgi:hypothetical protein
VSARTCCAMILTAMAVLQPARSAIAQSSRVTVLVDGSGSMTGFFTTGALPRLLQQLENVGADRVHAFTYHATPGGVVSGGLTTAMPATGTAGNVTLLGRALTDYLPRARDGEIVVMITDNVQDVGAAATEARDVRAFYDALTANPRLSYVHVVPLRLAFDGTLYGPRGAIGPYDDLRGVAAYLITVGEVDAAQNREQIRELAAAIGGSPIRMKPYRSAPVVATIDTAATRLLAAPDTGACPLVPLRPAADSPSVLVATRRVREGKPFGGVFAVRLDSRLEGVALSRPTVSASVTEAFAFTNFVAEGDAQVTPTPPRLQTNLEPGDSAAVRITICFPNGVRFAPNQALATSSQAGGRYEGTVTVGLRVPRTDLQLADQVKAAFSVTDSAFFTSGDPRLHRRIFGLEYAFRSLAPESVEIEQAVDGRLRFEVSVPAGPFLRLVGSVLGILLLLAVLGWALTRSHGYQLIDEDGGRYRLTPIRRRQPPRGRRTSEEPLQEPLFMPRHTPAAVDEGQLVRLSLLRVHPLRLNGADAGHLRYVTLVGPRVSTAAGFSVDGARSRALGVGGGAFTLSRSDAEARPSPRGRTRATRRPAPTASMDPDPFT